MIAALKAAFPESSLSNDVREAALDLFEVKDADQE
jgi:hypothetical protein